MSMTRRSRRTTGSNLIPTTERELRGWYSYGIAAEVFAMVGVGSFLPVTLEQLAKENGVLWSDRSAPCVKPKPAARSGDKLTMLAERAVAVVSHAFVADSSGSDLATGLASRGVDGRDPDQCVVRAYGMEMTTASFAMYTFSAAVFVQALVLVSFGSYADYGNNRKRLLLIFAFTGAIVTMSFIFVVPTIYLIAPFMVIIAITCFGNSFVLLNSFLPLLAANYPSIQHRINDQADSDLYLKQDESSTPPELQLSTKISSKGVGLGYSAALFVQCLSILVLFTMNTYLNISPTLPLRCVLLLAGAWWLTFTIPTAKWLRNRPGPPFPITFSPTTSVLTRYTTYVQIAWSSLYTTIKLTLRLRQATIFLLAWFLLSDATATVSGTAILFARTELKMSTVPIALLSITASGSGIVGAVVWPRVASNFKWPITRTIVACMCIMEITPVYGLLGYIPFFRRVGFGGLQSQYEMFPLAFIFGVVMGGLSSYCRSLFGMLIPPGHEAAFFALFAITDKGSSAIGPAAVGRIVDVTGHIRPAFWFLAVLIAVPVPLVLWIDVERGQRDARELGRRLEGGFEDGDTERVGLGRRRGGAAGESRDGEGEENDVLILSDDNDEYDHEEGEHDEIDRKSKRQV